jgi:hypothetical protein
MKARHLPARRNARVWLALTLALLQGASELLALQRKHR